MKPRDYTDFHQIFLTGLTGFLRFNPIVVLSCKSIFNFVNPVLFLNK